MLRLWPLIAFMGCASALINLDDYASVTSAPEEAFEQFKIEYNRQYEDEEEETLRFDAFNSTIKEIKLRSIEEQDATFAINQFADFTSDELASMRCGVERKTSVEWPVELQSGKVTPKDTYWDGKCTSCKRFPELAKKDLPIDPTTKLPGWDWVEKGAVTVPKAQGGCGGCWAFGGTGMVEGAHFMAGNDLVNLSTAQLLNCDHEGTDNGCGGSVSNLDTYEYVIKNGMTSWENYPWHGKDNNCATAKTKTVVAKLQQQYQISGIGHLNDSYPNITETFPGNSPWNLRSDLPASRTTLSG
jgi:C1A family cysteine protease